MPGAEKKIVIDGKELRPNPERPRSRVGSLGGAADADDAAARRATSQAPRRARAGTRHGRGPPGALKECEDEMHRILDAYATPLRAAARRGCPGGLGRPRPRDLRPVRRATGLSYKQFVERADDRAIRSDFEAAKKAFGADIAQSYVDYLAGPDDDADDDGLRDAYVRASALANVKEVREKVDTEAMELTQKLFAEHRVDIKGLSDIRQQEYEA